jgi:DNA (cytosine-5)-methyltransferase 1
MTVISIADTFCGIGGFRLGIEKAAEKLGIRVKCVFSSEIEKNAVKIYEKNFKETPSGDITKIQATDIPDMDILCGGFPCQAFSIAGNRRGFADTRGTLFFEIARIAEEKRPKIIFLENVKGLLNHDHGRTFGTILVTLDELGYDVEWQVLKLLGVSVRNY